MNNECVLRRTVGEKSERSRKTKERLKYYKNNERGAAVNTANQDQIPKRKRGEGPDEEKNEEKSRS